MAGQFSYGQTTATPAGVISYPKVFKAEASPMNPDKPKFSASILIPKQVVSIESLVEECKKTARELFGSKFSGKLAQFGDKQPFKDGDLRGEDDPAFGHWIISSNAGPKRKPWIFDRFNKAIENEEDVYGGMIGILWVQPTAYDFEGIKGVKLTLEGVQKLADGEPFQKRWNPVESCTTVAEVPEYLKSRVAMSRPSFGARDHDRQNMTPADKALVGALKGEFGAAPVADDDMPF